MNGKLKAVIYARFSCSKQREESISLDEIESSTSFSSSSPNKNKTNLEKSRFVLFFTRDYFGLVFQTDNEQTE